MMNKYITYLFSVGLFSIFCFFQATAQACQIPIQPSVTQFTSDLAEVGQSVTMTNCANGDFTSITLYSNTPHTLARLKIYLGKGKNGDPIYTQDSIDIDMDLVVGTEIILDSPVAYTSNTSYTFILDFTGGGTWQLHRSTLNLYNEGALYENGVEVENQDLRFIVQASALLPVELSFFNVNKDNESAVLHWQTASEQNNEGFEIERSGNGMDWEMIGFAAGQGTASEKHDYRFVDENPLDGQNYYRLRQIDFDGRYEYSKIRSVIFDNGISSGFGFYPNPVSAGKILTLKKIGEDAEKVILMDFLGRPIQEKIITEKNNVAQFNLPANLKDGIYLLGVYSAYEQTVKKLVVK